ncbi:NAD-glutamate dehydrogenase [Oceanicella actignis]|uniref:NAD-glutamate dehydrogenase n=1 Tax=Oceanicella actignis TaxID=1189325 RepID=UPI0011E658AA|nr:NAD-glutamate dehydrogenase [Oceanicella actignis]TYO85233.1 glutamate dehydrogenase [Oceanicella actignis]
MADAAAERLAQRLEEIRQMALERLEAPEAGEFVEALPLLYAKADADEVLSLPAEEHYGAALALWKFCRRRAPGRAKVRVYNPRMAEHGWQSGRTIVELCNDDMPFLVDSVTLLLTERGVGIHGIIHPVLTVRRDAGGERLGLAEEGAPDALRESVIQVQIDQIPDEAALAALTRELETMLEQLRAAVEDWIPMREALRAEAEAVRRAAARAPRDLHEEAFEFLEWVAADHFTFLGHRRFLLAPEGGFAPDPDSGLGLMRDPDFTILRDQDGAFVHWSPEMTGFLEDPSPIAILKANRRSNIHRGAHLDVIAVKTFDARGAVTGASVFIGLFTSAAYNRSPREIPLLRGKVQRIIERAGFTPNSHDGKALINVLETHPRDELFQCTEDQLFEIAMGILHLATRPRTRLFVRPDRFGRFMSCLVYVPRDRYNTELRERIGAILAEELGGRVAAWTPHYGSEALARVHFVVALSAAPAQIDVRAIEARIVEAVRSWSDRLLEALIEHFGEAEGRRLHARFSNGFPAAYRDLVPPAAAIGDIEKMDGLGRDRPLALHFYRRLEDPENAVRFKLYRHCQSVPLSDCLPVLENMGLRILEEQPFRLRRKDADGETPIWVHDFYMTSADGAEIPLAQLRGKLEGAFDAAWRGRVDNDRLNRLVLSAGLDVREAALLRAYARFLRQARIPYSIEYMEDALIANPSFVRGLVRLFRTLFDPANGLDAEAREAEARRISAELDAELEQVPSLDVDRILRRFRNAIERSLRTNWFQPGPDGAPKDWTSFKLDSGGLEGLPRPRPWREIFVFSTWVEGVHLRNGPVARGGLRWSDRKEDYRTEVLGLVKAQQVKNAVIVPVGSKGGFLPKALPENGSRDEVQAEAIRAYRTFLEGLLDVTDNLEGARVVPPAAVVRRDQDDPYLVVAADKGTATFSDIANEVAAARGFWLGDAFASGGSNGYDHKAMGITARGAWEAVKRHFRELGLDTQSEPFDVIGCGDMSGDVFGNGMLLSDRIRLIGAFDHRDIFIDPDPDPAASHAERRRLFELPRSSWQDYDRALISEGGGVFSRSAKSIPLSPQMKALTGIDADSATPFEVIRGILRARADLLWFGGIGTYVKAPGESDAEVGDRANDAVRVSADEVRVRVVGEGANLGVTQRGRIALARRGVKINTDAVDNSAGVDCSDHEVNIKIALDQVVEAGDLTRKQRNRLLAEMTDEVATLVLRDNYDQTLAISMVEARAPQLLDEHLRFMRRLESLGRLDREVEFLPSDEAAAELAAAGRGLTRPEIAVLIAYAKIELKDALTASSAPDDPFLEGRLMAYMPTPLRVRYADAVRRHRLRREIIATSLANAVVNECGPTFAARVAEMTGAPLASVCLAYAATAEIFEVDSLRARINALDNKADAKAQLDMHMAVSDMIATQAPAMLERIAQRPLGEAIAAFGPGVGEIRAALDGILQGFPRERLEQRAAVFAEGGAPADLAQDVAALDILGGALDIVDAARGAGRPVAEVAETYFAVGARLGLDWLRAMAREMVCADRWEQVAVNRLIADLRAEQSRIAAAALASGDGGHGAQAVDAWAAAHGEQVARAEALAADLRAGGPLSVAKLAVAASQLRSVAD